MTKQVIVPNIENLTCKWLLAFTPLYFCFIPESTVRVTVFEFEVVATSGLWTNKNILLELFERNDGEVFWHACIGNAISKYVILDYFVPQGSVLGPQWFTVYTSPVRDIIWKYNLNYHVYADDTQLYITFKSSQEPADSCITMLEKCIQEIRSWMRQNFLKLNDEKTEFLLIGLRQQLSKVSLPFITIGDSQITPSSQARNLGVYLTRQWL